MDRIERYSGALLGLAVGDALGTTLEFASPGSFTAIDDIIGGGPFRLMPGQWTDDTSMALCLAESLIECRGFDASDQMRRYVRWFHDGYLSSTGKCFDIGSTTRTALNRFLKTGDPFAGSTNSNSAGNGSLMRLAPIPLFFAASPEQAAEKSGESSRTTHGAPNPVDACRYYGVLIAGALNDVDKGELLSEEYTPSKNYWKEQPLTGEISRVAQGSYKVRNPPDIRGSGYVVDSLEAALWAFYRSSSFREGCLLAVNLGMDADTTGAVYGQLAGAYYGERGIPQTWRQKIAQCEVIETLAGKLFELAQQR